MKHSLSIARECWTKVNPHPSLSSSSLYDILLLLVIIYKVDAISLEDLFIMGILEKYDLKSSCMTVNPIKGLGRMENTCRLLAGLRPLGKVTVKHFWRACRLIQVKPIYSCPCPLNFTQSEKFIKVEVII